MRKLFLSVTLLCLVAVIIYLNFNKSPRVVDLHFSQNSVTNKLPKEIGTQTLSVAENLKIPWQILFLPNNKLLVTERVGRIQIIDKSMLKTIQVAGVKHVGEGGLLGATLHPLYADNHFIYLYFTTIENSQLINKVYRYTLNADTLIDEKLIVTGIKGSKNHDGGRIEFGPDGYLYITTGDAETPGSAQDKNSLNGKILRVSEDGAIPADNPFGNAVYSLGHRNPQGITWDDQGKLWETEHGPSGLDTGWDEINLIEKGKNYGWPLIKGDMKREGMETPVLHSGKNATWAPASAMFYNGSILFGGLRGQALYEYKISEKKLIEHFKNKYGRLRDVVVSPSGEIYVSTSNMDGRGVPSVSDDKILMIK